MARRFRRSRRVWESLRDCRFDEFVQWLLMFGFELKCAVRNHFILHNQSTGETVSVQNDKGYAKPFQLRRFLEFGVAEPPKQSYGGDMAHRYHINVFWSDEDDGYIADVPDLKHCSAFGATPVKAVQEALIAMDAWLRAKRVAKKPIPKARYKPAIYAETPMRTKSAKRVKKRLS